ncbi:TPA: hypothetical protein N2D99_001968 [Clostridium botulinum]|nr:hypothetical protein [Clostridium botulinum]
MNRMLSKEEEKEISPLLPRIIEIKQQICDIAKRDCRKENKYESILKLYTEMTSS